MSTTSPFQLTPATPTPAPGYVLIKNATVALNPVDYAIHHLGIWVDHYGFPALTGLDGAGTIAAVGEGVQGWSVGDRVLYSSLWDPDTMTFQEYSVSDARQIAKVPSNISFEGAATIPLGFSTAAAGYKKYVGQPAIVTGGASSVGQFAIQLLKASGFTGATHVIDYHSVPYASLGAAVREITSQPISVIYDAVSWPDVQKALWEILAPKGKMVVVFLAVVGKEGEASEEDEGKTIVSVYGGANGPFNYEFGTRMWPGITKLLESGDLKPNHYVILPGGLCGIPDGLTRLAKRSVSGVKLVARVEETAGEPGGAGLKEAVPVQVNGLRTVFPSGSLPNPM
ncbi:GroES-like protein [Irpex lacteus]|nr:GroES-like protein [Irpex lacteus]